MPCWYYDKKELKNTPSAQDGIDYETECRYRKEGARFIIDTGSKMDLGYNTTATGVVYFHRFYMFHSFCQFPRYVTACCCLFLAGKVEETPKKCKDIIKTARSLLSDQKYATFGDDPKEEVMTLERILLQTIKFDLQVEHPYSYLLRYAKCLKGDKAKLQKMVQMAWTFVNDSLCTTLALQWEPEIIAVALMYLAGKLSQFEVIDWVGRTPKHLRWWDMFVEDVTMDLLEDICHQVLDLYSQTNPVAPPDSPPPVPRPLTGATPCATVAATFKSNGQNKADQHQQQPDPTTPTPKLLPPPPDVPPFPYQTFTGAPPHLPPGFPTAAYAPAPLPPTATAPHLGAPPVPPGVYGGYVAAAPPPPTHYHQGVVGPPPPPPSAAAAYYQPPNTATGHRPYYPPQ